MSSRHDRRHHRHVHAAAVIVVVGVVLPVLEGRISHAQAPPGAREDSLRFLMCCAEGRLSQRGHLTGSPAPTDNGSGGGVIARPVLSDLGKLHVEVAQSSHGRLHGDH